MSDWMAGLADFHLLRPLWCLLLPVVAALWWWRRRIPADQLGGGHVAPHLADALRTDGNRRKRLSPVDTLALLACLLILAAAGPSWTRLPNPLVAHSAPLVVVLKVTSSMEATDVPPSRLERAKHKIQDLLKRRDGARTALVAYAGSVHQVVPLTDDPTLMAPYLEGLSTDVMPSGGGDAGADALALASDILDKAQQSDGSAAGSVLLVTDALPDAPSAGTSTPSPDSLNQLITLAVQPSGAPSLGDMTPGPLFADVQSVNLSTDDSDLDQIVASLDATYQQALNNDERLSWEDRGVWLAWPAALLALLGFRRGWHLTLAGLVLLPSLWLGPVPQAFAQEASRAVDQHVATPLERAAQSVANAFLTPDQQGRWWADRGDYGRAAEHFKDPAWKGYALYRDGQYDAAAEWLGRQDSADAAFTQGLALIKNRQYRPAITAFETVLERDPDYPEGERNLALAREILEYVEKTREQSDTGEDQGIGADDVVFDNKEARGEETQTPVDEPSGQISAEQWIETLDSDTSDYLRQRFAIEALQDGQAMMSSDTPFLDLARTTP